jgi:hypothetical protein
VSDGSSERLQDFKRRNHRVESNSPDSSNSLVCSNDEAGAVHSSARSGGIVRDGHFRFCGNSQSNFVWFSPLQRVMGSASGTKSADLFAARGEFESFQIAVFDA